MDLNGGIRNRFKAWVAAKTEPCRSVVHLLSKSQDQKLSITEKMRVKIHLFTCTACLNYLSNLSFIREAVQVTEREFEEETRPVKLDAGAAERIKKNLSSLNKME